MKKLLACLCGLVLALSATGCSAQPTKETRSFFAMNTAVTLTAYGDAAATALQEAEQRLHALERLWSVTDADSEIYAVNHREGETAALSGETAAIVSFALEMARETDGALDPTVYPVLTAWGFTTDEMHVPADDEIARQLVYVGYDRVTLQETTLHMPTGMQLDLGAVGKGYAGDELTALLKEQGVTSALLDIGGNIQVIGQKPDGGDWRLGIKDPIGDGNLGVLTVADCAVVTSGGYERYFEEDGKRYGHILDPATGRPAESGLAAAVVVAPEGRLCDALSTAMYVMGAERALDFWRQSARAFDLLLVTDGGEVYVTAGIADRFALNDTHQQMPLHVVER